jgi:uncharacterized protein (DUF342 family)
MHLKLKIDRSMTRASISAERENEGDAFTKQQILEFMGSSGVHAGIDHEKLDEMVAAQRFDEEVLVATAKQPTPGKDGFIEYLFDPHPKIHPEIRPDGSVDYSNVNILQKAIPDQVLARLIPPRPGEAGYDLSGAIIPSSPGRSVHLARGKNTSYADGEGTTLKADTHGHVRIGSDQIIEVVTVYTVSGDVNYTIGNIDFNGDVIITGDVLSGFHIAATGEISVKGVVEDAELHAGRNVVVGGGFIGSGKGLIEAGGSVLVRYVHHQRVIAAEDIVINNESINGHLTAKRAIMVTGGAGVLYGGIATAGTSIECKVIGNEKQTRTELLIPFESEVKSELAAEIGTLRAVEIQLNKFQTMLSRMEAADKHKEVDQARRDTYASLYATQRELEERRRVNQARVNDLEAKNEQSLSALYIRSQKTIHPGVNITIADCHYGVFEKLDRCHVNVIKGDIVISEYK